MINRWVGVGRLTSNPELRYTQSNIAFTRICIAINRNFSNNQGQKEADFINIVIWRKQAETICKYLNKGSLIGVEGRIQTTKYTDSSGKNRTMFEIVGETIQFLENKKRDDDGPILTNQARDFITDDQFPDFGDSVPVDYLE